MAAQDGSLAPKALQAKIMQLKLDLMLKLGNFSPKRPKNIEKMIKNFMIRRGLTVNYQKTRDWIKHLMTLSQVFLVQI